MFSMLMLATLGSAQAFEVKHNDNDAVLRWGAAPIRYSLNVSGAEGLDPERVENLVKLAASQFESISGVDIEFQYEGLTDNAQIDFDDGINTIYFESDWDRESDLLAVTDIWSVEDGEIIAFDMAINVNHHDWTTDGHDAANDLFNTLTHEFGHVLGLDHSDDHSATMYGSTERGELTKRDLANDDRDAIRYLYEGQEVVGCSSTGGRDQTPLSVVLVGFLSVAMMRRGRW